MNQFVNPQIGPRHRSNVLAIGLYSGSDLDTVGTIYFVPNSFSSLNSFRIAFNASGGSDDNRRGKRD